MQIVNFFGYGANRDVRRMEFILQIRPEGGYGAILTGYRLGYQTLDQIPEPAKSVLTKVWGKNFRAYTLKKGSGMVNGAIWHLDKAGIEKIKEWEFIDNWRVLIEVQVRLSDNITVTALTDMVKTPGSISAYVDGLSYPDKLNLNEPVRCEREGLDDLKELERLRNELQLIINKA